MDILEYQDHFEAVGAKLDHLGTLGLSDFLETQDHLEVAGTMGSLDQRGRH